MQVFYPDADDVTAAAATCDPWHGQVADILSHDGQWQAQGQGEEPQAEEGEQGVQADPYGCGGLWERFLVHWQPNTQVGPSSPGRRCCSKGNLSSLLCRAAVVVSQLVALVWATRFTIWCRRKLSRSLGRTTPQSPRACALGSCLRRAWTHSRLLQRALPWTMPWQAACSRLCAPWLPPTTFLPFMTCCRQTRLILRLTQVIVATAMSTLPYSNLPYPALPSFALSCPPEQHATTRKVLCHLACSRSAGPTSDVVNLFTFSWFLLPI